VNYVAARFALGITLLALIAFASFAAPASAPFDGRHANPLSLAGEDAPGIAHFIEVMGGCNARYEGPCIEARTKPGEEYPVALRLRTGMVLKVASTTVEDAGGHLWHRVVFDEWIRYPGRLGGELYVPAAAVREFTATEYEELGDALPPPTTKRIVVSRKEQKLYAYDGDELVYTYPVSTGLSLTPTPRGQFIVYRKTPSRYMQGPLPGVSDQFYDLPGVPWDLYFTKEGGTIHGAYWHDSFGSVWSHGCVNLPQEAARELYSWAPLGTPVLVRD
jgi:hypothetical protein